MIVVVGIWNGLLLGALGAVIVWRERLLEWVTGADLDGRYERDASGDELSGASRCRARAHVSGCASRLFLRQPEPAVLRSERKWPFPARVLRAAAIA